MPDSSNGATTPHAGVGLGIGLALVGVIFAVVGAVAVREDSWRIVFYAAGLVVAGMGVFGAFDDLSKIRRRAAMSDIGIGLALLIWASIFLVWWRLADVQGIFAGVLVVLASLIGGIGLLGLSSGVAKYIGESSRQASVEASSSASASAHPASDRERRAGASRGEILAFVGAVLTAVVTAAATVIAAFLQSSGK